MSDNQGQYLDSRSSDSPCKASNEEETRSFRLSKSKESREKSELLAGSCKEKDKKLTFTLFKISCQQAHRKGGKDSLSQ